MGDIVIIGGGFAGLEAARVLSGKRKVLGDRRVIIVDPKVSFDFLPVLPDVCGSFVPKDHVTLNLREYLESIKVNFENDEVVKIDTKKKEILLKNNTVLGFEYLILACGSITNFYGQSDIERRSLKLDSVDDALVVLNTVSTYPAKKFLIVGGGYTGVEIASNLAMFLKKKRIKKYSVNIIEKGEDILGALSQGTKDYCRINLSALRVNIFTESSIKEITDAEVTLSNGTVFKDYIIIWSAGVHTPEFVRKMDFDKDGQGRLLVDRSLKFSDGCFAAGDVAAFRYKGKVLRMAVQFSLAEARVAALNIVRLIMGKKIAKYRPIDLGFLVPLSNKKAIGKVLLLPIVGWAGWVCHYAMCIYRSVGIKNKLGIFNDCVKKLFR